MTKENLSFLDAIKLAKLSIEAGRAKIAYGIDKVESLLQSEKIEAAIETARTGIEHATLQANIAAAIEKANALLAYQNSNQNEVSPVIVSPEVVSLVTDSEKVEAIKSLEVTTQNTNDDIPTFSNNEIDAIPEPKEENVTENPEPVLTEDKNSTQKGAAVIYKSEDNQSEFEGDVAAEKVSQRLEELKVIKNGSVKETVTSLNTYLANLVSKNNNNNNNDDAAAIKNIRETKEKLSPVSKNSFVENYATKQLNINLTASDPGYVRECIKAFNEFNNSQNSR